MVNYENCSFFLQSGVLFTTTLLRVSLIINTTDLSGGSFANLPPAPVVTFFKGSTPGNDGEIVVFGSSLGYAPGQGSTPSQDIRYMFSMFSSQIKDLNSIDHMRIVHEGVTNNYYFTKFNYLFRNSGNTYGVRDIESIKSVSTFGGEDQRTSPTDFIGRINSTFDISAYDAYLVDVTGIDPKVLPSFPHKLPLQGFEFVFSGTALDLELLRYSIKIGRNIPRDPDIIINPEEVAGFTPPTDPPTSTPAKFTPRIISVALGANDFLECTYDILPTPEATDFSSIRLDQQLVSGLGGGFQSRSTNNHAQRVLTGFPVLEGQSVRIRLALLDIDQNLVRTELIVYTRTNDVLIVEDNFYEEDEIKSTKIHVTKVRDTTIDILLINDSFNDEFVTSVKGTIELEGMDIEVEVINNMLSSQLELKFTGLSADTKYSLRIDAITSLKTFIIQRVSIYTTITIPDLPTPEQKKEQAMQEIIRMAFEPETVDAIEVLEVNDQGVITQDILKAILQPENLGLTMDRNHFNRKGNVYNEGKSDAVKSNYPKTIEQILENNIIGIPDIDEGYA